MIKWSDVHQRASSVDGMREASVSLGHPSSRQGVWNRGRMAAPIWRADQHYESDKRVERLLLLALRRHDRASSRVTRGGGRALSVCNASGYCSHKTIVQEWSSRPQRTRGSGYHGKSGTGRLTSLGGGGGDITRLSRMCRKALRLQVASVDARTLRQLVTCAFISKCTGCIPSRYFPTWRGWTKSFRASRRCAI